MKTVVLGCGAIGGIVLGSLTEKGCSVTGIVKPYQKEALDAEGLKIEGVGGIRKIMVHTQCRVEEPVELAVFASKINDLEQLILENKEYLQKAVVVSTQNGVYADYILRKYFPAENILTGIVMFGATFYPPNKVVHNFPGDLVIGNMFGVPVARYAQAKAELAKALMLSESADIRGAKYLKVFVNLNNCIPAILGISMQEAFADIALARLVINLNREAFAVVQKSGISLESLPNYPKERLLGLVTMESEAAAGMFSKVMQGLSKEPLYGSILQSIKRGKKSEIDYINGEIVRLAQENKIEAPLNKKIVELVHHVEDTGSFLSKEDLIKNIQEKI